MKREGPTFVASFLLENHVRLKYSTPPSTRRVDDEYRNRVRDAAQGRWHTLLSEVGVPANILTGALVACPGCGGGPFQFNDAQGQSSFSCCPPVGHGVAGDGVMLIGHMFELRYSQALRIVGEALGLPELPALVAHRRTRRRE